MITLIGGLFGRSKRKNKNNKKTTRKQVNCFANKETRNNSCYNNNDMEKLRTMWNKRHPDVKINTKKHEQIWKSLEKNLSKVCKDELCWLERPFVDTNIGKKIKKASFAPMQPKEWTKDPSEWLTTIDIEEVLKQYDDKHPEFLFLGPTPIDFDHKFDDGECVFDGICNLDIEKQYNKGIRKIGFVFNLDPHDEEGSHWVSMFVDLDKNFIFYFDSNGEVIQDEIKVLMKRIKKQGKERLNKKLRFIDNAPREHQHRNTECGIYCIYAIVHLLEGKITPQTIKRKRIPDKKMDEFRKIYFNVR
jgi:hypothetical protein